MDKMERIIATNWQTKAHLFDAHEIKSTVDIFHSQFTIVVSSWFLHCIRFQSRTAAFDIRLPMWFDSNSDCNVWMTLNLPNKWNEFPFLWCFDTSQTTFANKIIRAIVYVRCKWSVNQSGLSVDFVACKIELTLQHTRNRAQNPAQNSVYALVGLKAHLHRRLNNIRNNFICLPIQMLWPDFTRKLAQFFSFRLNAENFWSLSLCSE